MAVVFMKLFISEREVRIPVKRNLNKMCVYDRQYI